MPPCSPKANTSRSTPPARTHRTCARLPAAPETDGRWPRCRAGLHKYPIGEIPRSCCPKARRQGGPTCSPEPPPACAPPTCSAIFRWPSWRTYNMASRAAGILLHPTSLPGPYGIGTLGPEAFSFADFLSEGGMGVWQVLPLGPTGYGDSPYQCFSAFAGNPLLISLRKLREMGLLSAADLRGAP